MSTVTSREYGNYNIYALWDFGPDDLPQYVVTVEAPDEAGLPDRVVAEGTLTAGPGTPRDIAECLAMRWGEEQADADYEKQIAQTEGEPQ